MEDQQRQNLTMAFMNALRTSPLARKVDLQRCSLAFGQLIDATGDTNRLDLAPLHTFLTKDQKAPASDVQELLIFLKSREQRFELQLVLPAQIAIIPAEEQARIVSAFAARTSTGTGTGSGATTGSGRGPTPTSEAAPATPTAVGGAPDFAADARRERSRTGPRKRLIAALVAVVGLGIGTFAYVEATRPASGRAVDLAAPGGFPCTDGVVNETIAICHVSKSWADAQAPDAVERAKSPTLSIARANGATRLLVFTNEDGALRWTF